MNKTFILLSLVVLFCIFTPVSCTNKAELAAKKNTEVLFLQYYFKEIVKKEAVVLNAPYVYDRFYYYLNDIKTDYKKIKFNDNDFNYTDTTKFNYARKELPTVKFITKSQLPRVLNPPDWKKFRLNLNKEGYYTITKPVISNDLQYAVFFVSFYCGDRCGHYELGLYKKTRKSWKLIKTYL